MNCGYSSAGVESDWSGVESSWRFDVESLTSAGDTCHWSACEWTVRGHYECDVVEVG